MPNAARMGSTASELTVMAYKWFYYSVFQNTNLNSTPDRIFPTWYFFAFVGNWKSVKSCLLINSFIYRILHLLNPFSFSRFFHCYSCYHLFQSSLLIFLCSSYHFYYSSLLISFCLFYCSLLSSQFIIGSSYIFVSFLD